MLYYGIEFMQTFTRTRWQNAGRWEWVRWCEWNDTSKKQKMKETAKKNTALTPNTRKQTQWKHNNSRYFLNVYGRVCRVQVSWRWTQIQTHLYTYSTSISLFYFIALVRVHTNTCIWKPTSIHTHKHSLDNKQHDDQYKTEILHNSISSAAGRIGRFSHEKCYKRETTSEIEKESMDLTRRNAPFNWCFVCI